jgi:hypothetical protein
MAIESLKLVCGSIVVYVIVAACASGGTTLSGDTSGDGATETGSSSSSGEATDDSGGMTTIFDALTDPVPPAKADTNQSGSRLKAKYYVGSDGSKQFSGWHDSMLNVDCSFLPTSDGSFRCVPLSTLAGATFSDSGCTQPLVQVAKGCTPGAYAYQGTVINAGGTTCVATSYTYRVFRVGVVYLGLLYTGTPASCTGTTDAGATSLRATSDYFAVASEMTSAFVAATAQTDP